MSKKRLRIDEEIASREQSSGNAYTPLSDDFLANLTDMSSEDTLTIMSIDADPTQPRRIIPAEIRMDWNGHAHDVPVMLKRWIDAAGLDGQIVYRLMKGKGDISIHDLKAGAGDNPVLAALLDVLDLAAQIWDVGLQQPIGVIRVGDRYRIIFGERRWLAYHLLMLVVGAKYDSIPAKVADVDAWELAKIQASENFQRATLNAIEKARQFAKLVMVARSATGDSYIAWQDMVAPGTCDRIYYAQAADGNVHRIPRGMGTEFESALNISTGQMRQYRALLALTDDDSVNDALWMLGDGLDWSERFMREIGQHIGTEILKNTLYRYRGNGITDSEALVAEIQRLLDRAKVAEARAAQQEKERQQHEERSRLARANNEAIERGRQAADRAKTEKRLDDAETMGQVYLAQAQQERDTDSTSDDLPEETLTPHPGTHMVGGMYWLGDVEVRVVGTQWENSVVVKLPDNSHIAAFIHKLSATPPPPEQSPSSTPPDADRDAEQPETITLPKPPTTGGGTPYALVLRQRPNIDTIMKYAERRNQYTLRDLLNWLRTLDASQVDRNTATHLRKIRDEAPTLVAELHDGIINLIDALLERIEQDG